MMATSRVLPARDSEQSTASSVILLLACPDRPGIVSTITTFVFERGGNILRAEQSESAADCHFYLRIHFAVPGAGIDVDQLRADFEPIAGDLGADWSMQDADTRQSVAIMVSRQPHCLLDLLGRWRVGDIPARIDAVISNHEDVRDVAEGFRVAFHHLPVGPGNKPEQENALNGLLSDLGVELVVLARYMQILSPQFIELWRWKVINIHHSFLPAFPGARPYHQAMERGVKLIGATAHYATADLDAGPIIEQGVTSTSHRDGVADFARRGREVEGRVLAAAVRAHLERRIIVTSGRTIVFE